jgi:hypothetical protein
MRSAKSPAERMRLFRRRRKFRRQVVKVEVDPGEIDALIDRGYLEPKDRDDLEVLAAAVTAFFSDALVTPVTVPLLARCNAVTCSLGGYFAVNFSASASLSPFGRIERVSLRDRCDFAQKCRTISQNGRKGACKRCSLAPALRCFVREGRRAALLPFPPERKPESLFTVTLRDGAAERACPLHLALNTLNSASTDL